MITKAAKIGSEADLGSFVLAQIRDQKRELVSFTTPEGNRLRICSSGCVDRKGEEVYWRVNLKELKRLAEKRCGFSERREAPADVFGTESCSHIPLTRLKPNPPTRDAQCVEPDIWPRPWGYKVRLYIEAEKELQELCGWRNLIVELDGLRVRLHHTGRMATMMRDAFKALLARNKRRKRPQLKIVVSNPPQLKERVSDAA